MYSILADVQDDSKDVNKFMTDPYYKEARQYVDEISRVAVWYRGDEGYWSAALADIWEQIKLVYALNKSTLESTLQKQSGWKIAKEAADEDNALETKQQVFFPTIDESQRPFSAWALYDDHIPRLQA